MTFCPKKLSYWQLGKEPDIETDKIYENHTFKLADRKAGRLEDRKVERKSATFIVREAAKKLFF